MAGPETLASLTVVNIKMKNLYFFFYSYYFNNFILRTYNNKNFRASFTILTKLKTPCFVVLSVIAFDGNFSNGWYHFKFLHVYSKLYHNDPTEN